MPKRLWAILAVTFGVSLSVLDGAIANVALPTIGSLLNISPANSIWIVNAYQLAIVVSLLSFSALGDVIGYRKIYIGGLLLFTIASAGCALSDSLATLVAARVCQGFGAAAVTSVNTTLIRIIYPHNHLGRGMGLNATVVAVSSVAGPTIAAGILAVAPWQWLFAINIPIGITAFFLSRRFLPDNPVKVAGRRFDWRDGAMNALTFGLLIASIEGYAHGIDPRYITTGIILLLIVGTLFVRSQLHKPYPILPFDLLKIPIFSVSVLTSICSFIAQMSAMVALPFYLQHTFGYSAVTTGLVMTAWPAVIVVVAPARRHTRRTRTCRIAGRHRTLRHDLRALSARLASAPAPRNRYHLAPRPLRARIRALPVAEQQHHGRLGTASPKRKCKRHARYGETVGTDYRSRTRGPALPHHLDRQHSHCTHSRGRFRRRRCGHQFHPALASHAPGTAPGQKTLTDFKDAYLLQIPPTRSKKRFPARKKVFCLKNKPPSGSKKHRHGKRFRACAAIHRPYPLFQGITYRAHAVAYQASRVTGSHSRGM